MNEEEIVLTVEEVIQETNDTITIVLKPEKPMIYEPGQFLMFKVPYDNKILRRAYSLSSSPHIGDLPAVTIKRVKDGKISNYFNDILKPDYKILSSLPQGRFTTQFNRFERRNMIFIGGGSGITPLISIIKSAIMLEPNSNIQLIYASRNEESIIFRNQIKALESAFSDRFYVSHILSQPSNSWKGYQGRINETILTNMIEEFFRKLESQKRTSKTSIQSVSYFLCGPAGMMKTTLDFLGKSGVDNSNIFYESFGQNLGIANSKPVLQEPSADKPSNVKINFEGNEYCLEVKPTETILEAALDEDIDLPFACSSGTCNICMAKCIKGNVIMEEDEGLTEEEINEKYILTCVSRPDSEDIEIEY